MRPGVIKGKDLSYRQKEYVMAEFLTPNGVRHFVPADSEILIHGNYFTVDTLDVVRPIQSQKSKAGRWRPWRSGWPGMHKMELPVKRRTYRIRTRHDVLADLDALDLLDRVVAGL